MRYAVIAISVLLIHSSVSSAVELSQDIQALFRAAPSLSLAAPEAVRAGPAADARGGWNLKEEKLVLEMVDSICADTWCESDFNFDFTAFKCLTASRSCTLTYYMWDSGDEEELYSGKGYQARFKRVSARGQCILPNISGINDVVERGSGGARLADRFYDPVNGCIGKAIEKASR